MWGVMLRPLADNEPVEESPENKGGLVIYLTDDKGEEFEVTRVAYARRHSRNPKAKFEDQLQAEITKAYAAADALNDALEEWMFQQDRELRKSYGRVRELIGEPEKVPA